MTFLVYTTRVGRAHIESASVFEMRFLREVLLPRIEQRFRGTP